jgi:trehalose 6-phosphate phosphatase
MNGGDAGSSITLFAVPPKIPTALLEPFVREPAKAGIFCDFDGTLSEIVLDPARARPVAESVQLLDRLSNTYGRVGVLSGRPLSFLQQFFPPTLFLAGLYGLEVLDGGARRDHPQAGTWREVVDDVAACSRDRGPAGMRVENKGLSITLHYRGDEDLAPAVGEWSAGQAARSGLVARPARKSIELHPPIAADKGTALHEAADGLSAVCFVGDDSGDLPAFVSLDVLADHGVATIRAAVTSDEVDPELVTRADVVVKNPVAVVELLRSFDVALPVS